MDSQNSNAEHQGPIPPPDEAAQKIKEDGFWKRSAKFWIGAALSYAICVVGMGNMLASEFSTGLALGAVMGLCVLIYVAPLHFLLQFVAHLIIRWLKRSLSVRAETLILNLPALIFLAVVIVLAIMPLSPDNLRQAFLRHFGNAMPASVKVRGFNWMRGLNEGSCSLFFEISPTDLPLLLTNQGYAVQSSSLGEEEMSYYRRTAQKMSRGPVKFEAPGSSYVVDTKTPSSTHKTLVVSSNGSEVLFLQSWH